MRQLSADTITADMSDVFGLQDRVVESIVNMLGLQLQSKDRQALVAHGTQEPAAYDYYLRGLGYLQDYHKAENVSSAIALFGRALERDPNYALAYAGLGEAYWARYDATYETEWLDQATQACERAVALDSDSAQGPHLPGYGVRQPRPIPRSGAAIPTAPCRRTRPARVPIGDWPRPMNAWAG